MKRISRVLMGILLWQIPLFLNAQSSIHPPTQRVVGYQIGEQGPNHRDWLKIVQTADAQGRAVLHTNLAYVELASGLLFKDPNTGKWVPSREEIDGYPGGAIAQFGQHKVIFDNNLNTAGAIDLQMPDGQEMKSDVLGLSYYDSASGKCVLIAEVQDSQGQIVGSNHSIEALKGQKIEWKDRLAAAKSIRERMDKELKDVLTAAQYAKLYSNSQQRYPK